MLCQVRERTGARRYHDMLRLLAPIGLAIVAAMGLASPESARAQMCDSATAGGGGTATGGTGTAAGGGVASAANALSMVQSAQSLIQLQQQRNRQLQQLRQRQAEWLYARRMQNVRDNSDTGTRRVGEAEAQTRREERKRLREERWAIRKARLNRMREEIELAKAADSDATDQQPTRERQLASITAQ